MRTCIDTLPATTVTPFHPVGWDSNDLLQVAPNIDPKVALTLAHTCLDTARGMLNGSGVNEDLDAHQLFAVRVLLGVAVAVHESLGLVP
jgi:hypothetical protein